MYILCDCILVASAVQEWDLYKHGMITLRIGKRLWFPVGLNTRDPGVSANGKWAVTRGKQTALVRGSSS